MPGKPQDVRSRQTSHPFEFFDSRKNSPGIGFPSLCRDLVLAPRNERDPVGYYAEIGVAPDASRAEIKAALRQLYVQLHPDSGADPDPERLSRVKLIGEVLLDDTTRLKYDRTPEGHRLMDAVYRAELSKLVIDEKLVPVDRVREALQPKKANPYGQPGRFDYFSIGYRTTDSLKAQQWYHFLLGVVELTSHRGRLRLGLYDNQQPVWDSRTEILMIPRSWEPSTFAAKALVTRTIGATGVSNLNSTVPLGGHMG